MTVPSSGVRTWATATSTNGERTIVYRFVLNLGAGSHRSRQSARVFLVWRFESETGMPSSFESQRMNQLEDTLAPHLEEGGIATLAMVSTGDGLREWTYYAESVETFLTKLNLAFVGLEPFPIEIHDSLDPDWQYYTAFVEGLQGKATPLPE
jgi:hypothetical protein